MSSGNGANRAAIVCIGPRPSPRLRLLFVPYAGAGTAAYRMFPEVMPLWLEPWVVRLPGRETRLREPPLTEIGAVIDSLAGEFAAGGPFGPAPGGQEPVPWALFGHSMGALVCFELARAVRRMGLPSPVHLFVSGRRGPQVPDDLPAIHRLPRQEFLTAVQRLGGIPERVLAEPGLTDVIAPALRADFALCETYRHAGDAPLPYGITAFGGRSDPTTTPERLAAWSAVTAGPFTMRLYSGDHFFIHPHRRRIVAAMCESPGVAACAAAAQAPDRKGA